MTTAGIGPLAILPDLLPTTLHFQTPPLETRLPKMCLCFYDPPKKRKGAKGSKKKAKGSSHNKELVRSGLSSFMLGRPVAKKSRRR